MDKAHKIQARIYYEDTDAGGIVYYSNYLKFAERGRTEYLRSIGFNHSEIFHMSKSGFVVKAVDIEYKAPAVLDDLVDIYTKIDQIKNSSIIFTQKVCKNEKELVYMKVVLVFVNEKLRPSKIPVELKQKVGI